MSENRKTVRVAVVDDSMFIRMAISRMLEDDPDVDLVGSADCGETLLEHLEEWRPDVLTLDLDMPGMGGLETLDHVMEICATPVIILSTHSGEGAPQTIEALHRGATDFIDKQRFSLVDFGALRQVLLEKIFEVTGHTRPLSEEALAEENANRFPSPVEDIKLPTAYDLAVIGASTGGPPSLQTILEELGSQPPIPVVVVQHMPKGFTHAFAERLNAHLPLTVKEAIHADRLEPGSVYIGVAGTHLRIHRSSGELFTELSSYPQHQTHTPSIDVLFESAARVGGRRVLAALLTGMGDDGAKGMAALKATGAYTMCQDEASSVVFGMPRAALALNAVSEIGDPKHIGQRIRMLMDAPVRAFSRIDPVAP